MLPEMPHRKVHVPSSRNLTDADVDAIVMALKEEMTNTFYKDLGRGVWGVFWKAAIFVVLGFAAYGHFIKGVKIP
jgi:hypothetical protein